MLLVSYPSQILRLWARERACPRVVHEGMKGASFLGSGLTCKHNTRLERLAREKHSSLLRTYVNYRCSKVFVKTGAISRFRKQQKLFHNFFLFTIAQRTRHISQHTFLLVEKARHISQHTTPVFVIVILKMLLTKCYL